ncbi:MAG TPA: MaoC/PaaZ C-terminal domain-containing protein [Burkholderiales bacterium]|nr:MaoC/PaaZ C-terminal domain-containing protein [Burkholderiales bacterium]
MATVECDFSLEHATAQGHFPGNPIIPGALLLSETLRAIEKSLGKDLCPCQIKTAKFVRPVRPGDRVTIEFSVREENKMKFRCTVGAATVLAGELVCNIASQSN